MHLSACALTLPVEQVGKRLVRHVQRGTHAPRRATIRLLRVAVVHIRVPQILYVILASLDMRAQHLRCHQRLVQPAPSALVLLSIAPCVLRGGSAQIRLRERSAPLVHSRLVDPCDVNRVTTGISAPLARACQLPQGLSAHMVATARRRRRLPHVRRVAMDHGAQGRAWITRVTCVPPDSSVPLGQVLRRLRRAPLVSFVRPES